MLEVVNVELSTFGKPVLNQLFLLAALEHELQKLVGVTKLFFVLAFQLLILYFLPRLDFAELLRGQINGLDTSDYMLDF